MGGSTQQPVVTQTQTKDPWIGAQPYLGQMYSTASAYQQGGVGGQPYLGPTMAPLDPAVQTGLGITQGVSSNLSNALIPQVETGLGVLGNVGATQGLTPQVQAALQGLGTTAGQYGQIYGAAQGAANPYLQAVIDEQNLRGNAAIQSSMSGAGRYGSGQYADVMARAQAQVADPLLMQDYEARQARALQATQGLGQTYGQQAGITQQALTQAMNAYGMMPQFAQAEYIPAQNMIAAGQYMQNYQQQALQGQIAQYNALQMYPWEQLQRESGILAGAGQLGGTTVTAQTPLQANLASRLAGGALVGAGLGSTIGGPLGAGLGAGGGALAGAFL